MKNQVGSTRIDTVLKMLAISFVSLFAFCTGVFIGKQMSDSDYQLKALESDFNATKQAKGEAHEEDAIADEEVAALSEKYVNNERDEESPAPAAKDPAAAGKDQTRKVASTTGAHGGHGGHAEHGDEKAAPAGRSTAKDKSEAAHDDDHAAPVAKTKEIAKPKEVAKADPHAAVSKSEKPDLSAAHKAAVRVANNAAPVEKAPTSAAASSTARIPSSLPKTVGASQDVEFTVQVASYPTADAAKEHASELVKKGFPAFPVEATINGQTWFRVSVGSFKTAKEATAYRGQLLKQAELSSAIVQRIQR